MKLFFQFAYFPLVTRFRGCHLGICKCCLQDENSIQKIAIGTETCTNEKPSHTKQTTYRDHRTHLTTCHITFHGTSRTFNNNHVTQAETRSLNICVHTNYVTSAQYKLKQTKKHESHTANKCKNNTLTFLGAK